MDWILKRCLNYGLVLLCFLVVSSGPVYGQQPGAPSARSLQGLVDLMENQKKREAFVRDLKDLIEAKKATDGEEKKPAEDQVQQEGKQLEVVRYVFGRFENLSRDIRATATATINMVARTPEAIRNIRGFFAKPENLYGLFTLCLNAGGAILVAFILALFLRRPVRAVTGKEKDLPSKVGWGFVRVVFIAIPYATLWVVFNLLYQAFPSLPEGGTVLILFFTLLFLYQVGMKMVRVLLSPDEKRLRILPFEDENANYLWIWTRRFTIYAFFYFMVTRSLLWTNTASHFYPQIRSFFLLGFPLMLTVFILQITREIRLKQLQCPEKKGLPAETSNRFLTFAIRYWPILALGYAWAIFLTLMFQFEKGFLYLFHATLGTGVSLLFMFLFLRFLDWLLQNLFKVNELVSRRFPGLEEKANRYVLMIRKGFAIAIAIVGVGVIGQIWGIPVATFVASETGALITLRTIAVIITLALVVFIVEVSQLISTYLIEEKKGRKRKEITQKQKTLIPVIKTAVQITAGFIGGIIILDRLGVNTTPILAGAGIVGLAVGFGSQTLVKDLINGLFILFEESIRVGDFVMVDNKGGMVEAVGLRTVKLRDINGTVHVIPNSSINTSSNYSKVFSRTVMDIGVAYREDVDQVIAVLKEVAEDLRNDPDYGENILEPLEVLGLDRFDDSAVVIRIRFKTKPLKQWGIKREFYRRLKRVFDERGIEIPFPHRTVYMGEPKEGPSPPMHVKIQEEKSLSKPASDQNST